MGMRLFGATIAVLLGISGAFAPDQALAASSNATPAIPPESTGSLPPATPAITEPGIANSKVTAPPAAMKPSVPLRDSYAAIPLSERVALQSDLVWAGLYNGPINGEFGDPLVNAVKAFQKQNKSKQTGILNPYERAALIELVRPLQEQVGWQVVYDAATGARVGLPAKLVPKASAGKAGSLWSSAQGQVRIETFRIATPDTTLAGVFEQQKSEPSERKIESQALRPDSFVIIGMQGLKKFHVRGYARGNEVRGITILYDQAVDGTLDPLVTPMANSFQPFVSNASIAQDSATPRRKIEYGTGLVVSSAGHIVTDLQVAEACQVVIIPGLGNAERLAADHDHDLALLRVYGADDLVPLALLGDAAKGPDLTLIGIADPQSQAGNAAISTATAKLVSTTSTAGTVTTLNQAPTVGYSGAAALDKGGRFFGMVELKIPVVAGTTAVAPKATIVPAETIKNFIEANYVAPSSGQTGVENAKASVVRVICVRK
jgi:peptidoglycan hydrolase-like protein with peptidoglycan-binding domain